MMAPVWWVRSHQIAGDLRYWLTYIGYDKRDHSLSHKIYLAYATLFFSVWAFATLALLASVAGRALGALAGATGDLAAAAAAVLALTLLAWWLYVAFAAASSSPLTFSEDDAALICQAPVSRPAVALLWLLGAWIRAAPLFWGLGVTLAFALQDAALGDAVSVEHTPRYVAAALRVLSVLTALHWGLMALAWAWGVLRLQGARVRPRWWLGPLALLAAFGLPLAARWAAGGGLPAAVGLLQPLVFPLAAGLGAAAWGPGVLAALAWGLVGTLALGWAARSLNLGRAAQESTGRAAGEAAAMAGNAAVAADIALRRRLGMGHAPTRLPALGGAGALAWKTALAWQRQGAGRLAGPLLLIFISGLGLALAPDWGTRAWAALAWVVMVEQFAAAPLVSDLRLWPQFRGLPLATRAVLLADLAMPLVMVVLVGLLSLAAAALPAAFGPAVSSLPAAPWWGNALPAAAVLLLPGAALGCGLAAALDVTRSASSSRLLTGQAPMPGTTGALVGVLCCGLVTLAVGWGGGGWFGYAAGALVSGSTAWLLLSIAEDRLRHIE